MSAEKTRSHKYIKAVIVGLLFVAAIISALRISSLKGTPRDDIADNIMKHYGNYKDLFDVMKENIKKYLNENGFAGINIKQSNGDIIPAS